MLSFIDENTCSELADGVMRSACEYATANPVLALGLTAGTMIAGAAGLFFSRRGTAAPAASSSQPVARLKRQTVSDVIIHTTIDQSLIVAPVELTTEQKMARNLIVLAELNRQLDDPQTAKTARQLLQLRQNPTNQKVIDGSILEQLGYAADGQKKPGLKP